MRHLLSTKHTGVRGMLQDMAAVASAGFLQHTLAVVWIPEVPAVPGLKNHDMTCSGIRPLTLVPADAPPETHMNSHEFS